MTSLFLRAHHRFRNWEPYLGLLIGSGFFTWVAKRGRVMGVDTWEEAVFVGFGAASVLMLALAAILAGYRYFKPLEGVETGGRVGPAEASSSGGTNLRIEIDQLRDDLLAVDRVRQSQLEGVETQLIEIAEDRKAIIRDYQAMRALESGLNDHKLVFEAFREEMLGLNDRFQFALVALRARETERFYANQIEEIGQDLEEQVRSNRPFQDSDWFNWDGHQVRMEGAMHGWLQLADAWRPEVRAMVNDVAPQALMPSVWGQTDELFENNTQMLTYKTEIIKLRNWKRVRHLVADDLETAAFGGEAAVEILQLMRGAPVKGKNRGG
jgi:hypothetical protein